MFQAISLRDYLAGQALSGLLAFSPPDATGQMDYTSAAEDAYDYADAMLAERAKRPAEPAAMVETNEGETD
jgi:hypothetical protein